MNKIAGIQIAPAAFKKVLIVNVPNLRALISSNTNDRVPIQFLGVGAPIS
jgi:hypothetical protein